MTIETIERRAWWYRALVVCIALLIVLLGAASFVLLSWTPLTALLLSIPLCAAFFWHDGRIVASWRDHVLRLWADQGMDLQAFHQAMLANRALPNATVRSMFDSLMRQAADGCAAGARTDGRL